MKKNIIHSVQVEINTTSLATANAIKSSIDDIIKNEIFPRIEKLLERAQTDLGADESLQIEMLELDLTIEKSELNSAEMVSALTEQLERALLQVQKQKSPNTSKISEEYLIDVQHPLFSTRSIFYDEKSLESFFFFIRTGTKPWWISNSIDLKELLEPETLFAIIHRNKKAFSQRFLKEIQRESSRKRIIAQFSDKVLVQFVVDCFHSISNKELEKSILTSLEEQISHASTNNQTRKLIWELILQHIMESSSATMTIELQSTVETVFKKISERTDFPTTGKSSEAQQFITVAEVIVSFIFTIHHTPTVTLREIRAKIKRLYEEFMAKKNLQNSSEVDQITPKTDPILSKKTEQNTESLNDEVPNSTAMETSKKEEQLSHENNRIRIPSDGLHVDHAGLILLYPFLGHFFKHIGLMDDQQKLLDRELAAHIMHYIATGKENDWEFELVFEKYLVGIQIDESLSKDRIITNQVKEEVDSMLNAVKSNWKPMMNSSNELLQYEFLQRPGKLVVDGQHQRLVMEKKTQDILLNQLTWTISIVRFPWRDELIYVEW